MNCLRRECRQTDGDVLGAVGPRRTITDPLARLSDDGLADANLQNAAFVFDTEHTGEHNGYLVEGRPLAGLDPTTRRFHASDAELVVAGIHAADEFFDQLRLVPGCRYARGLVDELWHDMHPDGETVRISQPDIIMQA